MLPKFKQLQSAVAFLGCHVERTFGQVSVMDPRRVQPGHQFNLMAVFCKKILVLYLLIKRFWIWTKPEEGLVAGQPVELAGPVRFPKELSDSQKSCLQRQQTRTVCCASFCPGCILNLVHTNLNDWLVELTPGGKFPDSTEALSLILFLFFPLHSPLLFQPY